MARSKTEAAKSKVASASTLAGIGASIGAVGGPVGASIGGGLGAITGLIIGDQETIFPIDMIAIPAYQSYLLTREPAFAIYIKEGEVLTQVVQTDAQEAEAVIEAEPTPKQRKKITPYQRKYRTAFNKVKGQYKKKDGTWKKGGFRAAVKAAHKIAGGKK